MGVAGACRGGVSGGGLTWTLRSRANAQPGTAEIWQAVAPTPLTNATITATRAKGGYQGAISVAAFVGADTTVNGAVGSASAASGAPSASLVTTKAGDLVELYAPMDTLVVLTAIQHPLDPSGRYAPKPVHLALSRVDPAVAELCRTSCEENVRGFINTDRLYL